jgi:UPF0148 protein
MSEEFDKEAEREKLREKFEKDEEKRQETQRMSELLLQGATMTNEHCDRCGDPLFRDGGETFCPTCSGAGGQEQAADTQQAAAPQQQSQQPSEAQQPTQPTTEAPQNAERTNGTDPAPQPETGSGADVRQQAGSSADEQPARGQRTAEPTATDAAGPRAELQRAVTTTARNASEATDPRTAKEWLEASKEAAEALAALEQ